MKIFNWTSQPEKLMAWNKQTRTTNSEGDVFWYVNGLRHRDDGPAVEIMPNHKEWWIDGKRHRTGAPAVECSNGDTYWFENGRHHRLDGPAAETHLGVKQWWYNDTRINVSSQAEFLTWLRRYHGIVK